MESNKIPAYFVFRRLFSLSGILIGIIFFWNIYTFAKSLSSNGVGVFNASLSSVREIPFLVPFEIFFFFIPLIFHVAYGLSILSQGRGNILQYAYQANLRYWLQRILGIICFAFIFYHLYATRFVSSISGIQLDYLWMVKVFESPLRVWIYLFGTTAALFYFLNGFWSSLITWGITISPQSQKKSLTVCMVLFCLWLLVNTLVITNFSYHYQSAPGWVGGILKFVKGYLFR